MIGTVLSMKHLTLNTTNFVSLRGPVTSSSVDHVIWEWNKAPKRDYIQSSQETLLYMDTPGGSVKSGNHLISYIKTLQAQNITVHCLASNFMSMGFAIMQACDHRMVLPHSIGMQHQMSFGLRGDLEKVRVHFNLNDYMNEQLVAMEIARIGLSRDDYQDKILNDWWLFGEKNLEENTADEMVVFSCDSSLLGKVSTRNDEIYGIPYTVTHHQCPLFKETEVSEEKVRMYFTESFGPVSFF